MTESLLAITLFAITMTGTPGPNNIMIMSSGVNFGIRRSLPHFFGICFGTPLLVFAVGIGLGALFAEYTILHTVVKVVGVSYLLFLAWKIANAAQPGAATARSSGSTACAGDSLGKSSDLSGGTPLSFLQAVLFQWVNPKAWVISIGAIAAFTSPDGSLLAQVLTVSAILLVCAHFCVGLWLVCGYSLRSLLGDPVRRRLFNWTMAGLLVASVATIV